MLQCAEKVLEVTGSKSEIRFEALPQDDPKQRRPDITKARTLLGWEPKIDLTTGLKLSLDYFKTAVAKSTAAGKIGITDSSNESNARFRGGNARNVYSVQIAIAHRLWSHANRPHLWPSQNRHSQQQQ